MFTSNLCARLGLCISSFMGEWGEGGGRGSRRALDADRETRAWMGEWKDIIFSFFQASPSPIIVNTDALEPSLSVSIPLALFTGVPANLCRAL